MTGRLTSPLPLIGSSLRPAQPELDDANLVLSGIFSLSNRVLLFWLFALLLCGLATSHPIASRDEQTTPDSATNELVRRLDAAMEARASGDLDAITLASQRVIALGLVAMAKIQLDDRAYGAAARLCRESLEFEDTPETRVELAIVSLYAKKPGDAVEQASLAIEKDPRNALAWSIKGEALLQQENYAGAAASLSRSVELNRDAESIYALGIAYLGIGEKQKAADSFSQLLALVGDHGWSRILVGRAYQQQKQLQEAESEYQNALTMDPRTPTAHYFWALALLQANGWSSTPEVRAHLMEELKSNPRHLLANYLLGYFASNERNFDESDHYLQKATEIDPSLPESWMFLGLNAQARKSSRIAESYLRKAISLAAKDNRREHPSIRRAYFVLGRILISTGRNREGEQLLQKFRELQQVSLALSQKKDDSKDIKDGADTTGDDVSHILEAETQNTLSMPANQSLSYSGDSPPQPRARQRSSQNPTTKSEKHLRSLLGSSLNDLATAEALQEKYDLAVKHYREAWRWDPQIPGLQRNLGLAAFFVGENDETIRLLARAVTAAPSDDHARAVLGLAYFGAKDYAKAALTIAPIADRAVQDPQLGVAWAKSLAETGNKKGAVHALRSIDRPEANLNIENLIQFGKISQELGESELAAQFFRRALVIDPTNPDAQRALGTTLKDGPPKL